MEVVEPKKRSVPGAGDIIRQIRTLTNSIQAIEDEIKSNIEKVNAKIEAERANSKKGAILAEFRVVSDELQAMRNDKKRLFDELAVHKDAMDKLRETNAKDKNAVYVKDPEDIDKKIDQLNMRLITESISPVDEKKIAGELLTLRSMKTKLGDIEESKNKIKDVGAALADVRAKIHEIMKAIATKTAEKDKIKIELDKASSSDRAKSPEVVKLETKIAGLKAQKQGLIAQKNERKEAVRVLEAEWAEFEVVLQEQQKLEEQKSKIKKVIQELRNKKDELSAEIAGFDPKIFDTLYYSISALKKAKMFSININLVDSLMKHGIKIPSGMEDVDETLNQLVEKKNGSMSSFKDRSDIANKEIATIDSQIAEAVERLGELPPTDYDILKKGGRQGFKNK